MEELTSLSLICVFVHVHVCAGAHVCEHMWKQRDISVSYINCPLPIYFLLFY